MSLLLNPILGASDMYVRVCQKHPFFENSVATFCVQKYYKKFRKKVSDHLVILPPTNGSFFILVIDEKHKGNS